MVDSWSDNDSELGMVNITWGKNIENLKHLLAFVSIWYSVKKKIEWRHIDTMNIIWMKEKNKSEYLGASDNSMEEKVSKYYSKWRSWQHNQN